MKWIAGCTTSTPACTTWAGEVWRAANRLVAKTAAEAIGPVAAIDPGRPWREKNESLRDETPASEAPAEWKGAILAAASRAEEAGFSVERLPLLELSEAP